MDLGHQLTDEELEKLERKIAKVYKTAADEMQDKITEYFKKFDEQDKKKRKLLEQGKITEQEYKQWRLGKLATGKKYQSMRDQLAERMTNANQEAVAYVNSSTPTVYSLNRNYTAYQIEQADINASFQLWDENTVARLIKDNPELMPNYPKEKALARGIDLDWGKKQISKEITTGILLGESNQSIAKRLLTELPDMNKASAIRTARTATTSAECAGRQDTYESAKAMGIVLKKRWMCTHDARTREEHLAADGQSVDVDKPFEVGGEKLMNPGDTSGSAWNIMNCRCTTVADIDTKASAKNKNPVSFNAWVEEKQERAEFDTAYRNTATLKYYDRNLEWSEDNFKYNMEYLREGWQSVASQIEAFNEFDRLVPEFVSDLKSAINQFDFSSNADDKAILSILKDGRFKSQIETGASKGYLDIEKRQRVTRQLFNYSEELSVKDSEYEIYGYLDNASRAKMYGNCRVVFKKDNLRGRTTLTVGDSLELLETGGSPFPSLVNDPKIMSYGENIFSDSIPNAGLNLNGIKRDFESIGKNGYLANGNYVELQFHGGVSIDDIDFIEISKTSQYASEIEKLAKEKGVKIKWKK